MRVTLLVLLYSLPILSVLAQESVTGRVLDENGEPLVYATVTIHSITGDSILAFTFTNNNGAFTAGLPDIPEFEIRASSIGKKTDTIHVAPPYDFPLKLVLFPTKNDLPEITVKTDRKPIVENGDTTVYSVGQFQEVDDERIEAILRKIPGVDVAENGSITVKGKPLHRILIEGSDLFGQDYQLASKNIRAKNIATIEEIDHYQENAVLRSVNESEAIVLNLKLKEEAKSILSGSVVPGIGYGEEVKYSEFASIFNVSKKNKAIFIGNLDNVASGFGNKTLETTYNSSQAYNLRENINDRFRLLGQNVFDNLGLSPEYTDNGRSAFATLRNETNLSSRWTLNVNGVYGNSSKAQQQIREQYFLLDSTTFNLREVSDWSNQTRYFEPEIELSYLDGQQKTAFDLFAKTSREDFSQLENRLLETASFGEKRTEGYQNTSIRALFSRELRAGLVGLLEVSTGVLEESLLTTLRNAPLRASLELADTTAGVFHQSLALRKSTSALKPILLYSIGSSILKWESIWAKRQLEGIHAPGTGGQNTFFPGANAQVDISSFSSTLSIKLPIAQNATLRTSAMVGAENYSYRSESDVYPYRLSSTYEVKQPQGTLIRLSLSNERTAPTDPEHLFSLPLVTSLRTATLPGTMPNLEQRTKLAALWGRKNDLRLSYLRFQFSAVQATNVNFQAVEFTGSTILYRQATGRNQRNVTGSVRYDKFIAPIKSNLILGYTAGYSLTDYVFDNRDVSIRSSSNNFNVAINGLITRSLRFKGGSRLSLTSIPSGRTDETVTLTNLKLEGEVILNAGLNRFFIGVSNALTGVENRSNNLYANFFGIKREVKTQHRTIMLDLRVYNLTNQGDFARIDSDTVFEDRTLTPAIGRFLLLKVDYGL